MLLAFHRQSEWPVLNPRVSGRCARVQMNVDRPEPHDGHGGGQRELTEGNHAARILLDYIPHARILP
jgi:hypothetical protein